MEFDVALDEQRPLLATQIADRFLRPEVRQREHCSSLHISYTFLCIAMMYWIRIRWPHSVISVPESAVVMLRSHLFCVFYLLLWWVHYLKMCSNTKLHVHTRVKPLPFVNTGIQCLTTQHVRHCVVALFLFVELCCVWWCNIHSSSLVISRHMTNDGMITACCSELLHYWHYLNLGCCSKHWLW